MFVSANRQVVVTILVTILVSLHQTNPKFKLGQKFDKSNAYMKVMHILLLWTLSHLSTRCIQSVHNSKQRGSGNEAKKLSNLFSLYCEMFVYF